MEVRTEVYMAQEKKAFGSYSMVNISTTNTTKIRCVPDTVLKASINQVGYYSMNAFTRKQMHIYNWGKIPITEEIIEQVEKLAGDEVRSIM